MVLVENAGLFTPVAPATLEQVGAPYRPAHGKWVGIAARSTVFVYNTSKLNEAALPKSLMDLADPAWKGRWAASPAGADFQAIVSAVLELKGEAATLEWLKGMKANATAYRGNSSVLKAVNAGQIDGGVIYHYYSFVDQNKTGENSKNTALHYFKHKDPGAFVSLSGGGVLASSKHQEEAQEEIEADTVVSDLAIGFNVNYLLDALSALRDEHVVIQLRDSNSSALVREASSEKSRHVVMPLRL